MSTPEADGTGRGAKWAGGPAVVYAELALSPGQPDTEAAGLLGAAGRVEDLMLSRSPDSSCFCWGRVQYADRAAAEEALRLWPWTKLDRTPPPAAPAVLRCMGYGGALRRRRAHLRLRRRLLDEQGGSSTAPQGAGSHCSVQMPAVCGYGVQGRAAGDTKWHVLRVEGLAWGTECGAQGVQDLPCAERRRREVRERLEGLLARGGVRSASADFDPAAPLPPRLFHLRLADAGDLGRAEGALRAEGPCSARALSGEELAAYICAALRALRRGCRGRGRQPAPKRRRAAPAALGAADAVLAEQLLGGADSSGEESEEAQRAAERRRRRQHWDDKRAREASGHFLFPEAAADSDTSTGSPSDGGPA
eukprot:TRINITY_DN43153_c0_g1_i1.p2 TRINITY_DN43153_c0_g1~~TRINITY_DN43153_c0_g1_i1.p2  ORF type:complete len:363 (+),score=93.87 TRINITY_DN43153_c0_g1_i1:64-1152(+)